MIDQPAMHWCDQCGHFLKNDNPGERLYGARFILCLRCAKEIVARLEGEAKKAGERK